MRSGRDKYVINRIETGTRVVNPKNKSLRLD